MFIGCKMKVRIQVSRDSQEKESLVSIKREANKRVAQKTRLESYKLASFRG